MSIVVRTNPLPTRTPEDIAKNIQELVERIAALNRLLIDAISRIETLEGGGP